MTREEFRKALPLPLGQPFAFHAIAVLNLLVVLVLALVKVATIWNLVFITWFLACMGVTWFFVRRRMRERWTQHCERMCEVHHAPLDYEKILNAIRRELNVEE